MDKAAKAEARIKQTCDRLGITDGGRQWLDVALDPFKDITQRPIGFPDIITAPSVVQAIHDSITVTAPSGVVVPWDCNIFLDTLWKQTPLRATTALSNSLYDRTTQTGGFYNRGGLVVRGAASGTPLRMPTTYAGLPYVTDVFNDDTSSRVIAIGLEVHNTTAELNKQGSITTYRIFDEPATYPVTAFGGTATASNNMTCNGVELIEPPQTNGQAIDLPGSLQWDAAKGAYVVPRFISESNEPVDLRPLVPIVNENSTGTTFVPAINLTGVTNNWDSASLYNGTIPFGLAGVFLTGLSPTTSLVCNLTYYVEQFPSVDSALRRVAGPSCVEDFAALELYTKVSRHMPTGVEVNDNFLGAFISGVSRVMSTVTPYIPRIVNFLSGASEVVSQVQRTYNNDAQISRDINVQQPQRQLAIVPYKKPSSEVVVHDNKNGSREIVISQPKPQQGGSRNQPNGRHRPAGQTVKNSRSKDFNRLNKYIKASNAGNRYIM